MGCDYALGKMKRKFGRVIISLGRNGMIFWTDKSDQLIKTRILFC